MSDHESYTGKKANQPASTPMFSGGEKKLSSGTDLNQGENTTEQEFASNLVSGVDQTADQEEFASSLYSCDSSGQESVDDLWESFNEQMSEMDMPENLYSFDQEFSQVNSPAPDNKTDGRQTSADEPIEAGDLLNVTTSVNPAMKFETKTVELDISATRLFREKQRAKAGDKKPATKVIEVAQRMAPVEAGDAGQTCLTI